MRYFHELIIAIILGIGLFIAGFYIGANSSFYFLQYKQRKAVQNLAKEMQKAREKEYQRLMADTYGGKTPQETLQMFIEAVEKGDYELASKYFVNEKQKDWQERMQKLNENSIKWLLNKMLKGIEKSYGDSDKTFYTIEIIADQNKNIKYSTISFIKYPNNIWKINNIEPREF